MKRLFVNLAGTFVLVLLLAAPAVFSNNLVEFSGLDSGIKIYNNSQKFGQFLTLEEIKNSPAPTFNLELTSFDQNLALYKEFLTIENTKEVIKKIKIVNNNLELKIFFTSSNSETYGLTTVALLPGQRTGVDLLVPPQTLSKTASFSLELSE